MRAASRTFARHPDDPTRSDAGFTLIELMASLTLMAVGIVGVIGVMNSSFRVVGTAASRSRATAVATKWVEYLRSRPYDEVKAAGVSGATITKSDTVSGQTFTVRYTVTQENEATANPTSPSTTIAKAYQKAYIWVSWSDASGYHDLYQTTLVYPGGKGVFNAAATVTQAASNAKPLKPKSLTAIPVLGTSSVDLAWVPPDATVGVPDPASWVVQFSRSSSFLPGEVQEVATSLPTSVTTLRVSDLAEGTTYHFRVYSKSSNGTISADSAQQLNVTTLVSGSTACSLGTASVTPSAVKKKAGNDSGKLESSPQVEVQLVTSCTGTTFQIEYAPRDGETRTVALAPVALRPGTLTAAVDGTENLWAIGDHGIDVYSYTSGVKKLRANLRLVVCDNGKSACP
ncbi:MAG TPA: fibronectin type III domain-containing protein [Acidimicrobiales bacterium]|nr:fibronectin type III domain-containing protein [Acidimicrobiales bacterium]